MGKLLILGAGQHGRVVKEIAELGGQFEEIAFLDDKSPLAIGKLEEYLKYKEEYQSAHVAFGNAKLRREWIKKLMEAGFELPVIAHPTAIISESAQIGPAVVMGAYTVVNRESVVGCGTILAVGAKVDHNVSIGKYCHMDCGAIVECNAVVPNTVKVEAGGIFRRDS